MAEEHVVVDGATCKCRFSVAPQTDVLVVKSHQKEYANDKEGSKKLIATTLEIGQTLQANTFGNCKMQPVMGGFLPCMAMITQWSNFYKKVTLQNGGQLLTEKSKATCPIGGPDCISIDNHGQKTSGSKQNSKNANKDVHSQLNPMVNIKEDLEKTYEYPNLKIS
jgi:hypothetical protein